MTFKERLHSGNFLLGTHINANDPSLTELIGQCGFDYLWIDTEHTAIDYAALQNHLIAARSADCPALVRVPWNESFLVKRVLDLGPNGIIFPMIRSVQEARQAMDACIYPPGGNRSYGPIRAASYGLQDIKSYLSLSRESLCRFIQIEHIDAVRDLNEILTVPGIDGLILGPCDLSGSMGMLGQLSSPEIESVINHVIDICRAAHMPVGISLGPADAAAILRWRERGVNFLSFGSEYGFISQCSTAIVNSVKNSRPN